MPGPEIIVKVGGSLFDLPDLGPRFRGWLDLLSTRRIVIVPGGGRAADLIRDLDRHHQLGEEAAHWLALRAMSFNAHVLATLLPGAVVMEKVKEDAIAWPRDRLTILDAYSFAKSDEGQPGCLPHCWSVTSDSVAVRVARVVGAQQLILLKSVTIPESTTWAEAGRRGWVDPYFALALESAQTGSPALQVLAVNFRDWP